MVNFTIFFFSLIALFLAIDLLQKKVFTRCSWSRKATHVTSGVIIMFFPDYLSVKQIVIMSGLFVIILFISKVRNILSLHVIKRFSWGEVYYPFSIGVLALLCLPDSVNAFYAGVLCLALSDAAAAMVGGVLPLKKLFFGNHQKSVGGLLGFFATTICIFCILFLPLGANLMVLIAIAIMLSIAELFTFYGADNLVVPILAALLSLWLL